MAALGFEGPPAELLGLYAASYPAFIVPVLVRAKQKGATISDRTKIVSMIHYAPTVTVLAGFGLFRCLVAIGLPPADAFSIGPIVAGFLSLGLLCSADRLERWRKARAGASSRVSSDNAT